MRIAGVVLILVGGALLVALTSLFYAPIPNVAAILVTLGMPGILMGALIAILILGAGFLMALGGRRLGWPAGRD